MDGPAQDRDITTAGAGPRQDDEDRSSLPPRAVQALIRHSGAIPVSSIEDLDRFRVRLWDSDAELEAFLVDVRVNRDRNT